ncbi:MAG: response regulator transcription factor [Cryomorphaceae bacterium]|jgi:DNA-binding NarL/FixJ family response regulator|nr:response regulator transcription factor [Cryomorphaceae bacterium]
MIQIAIVEDITRIAEALKAKILLSPDFKLKFIAPNGAEIIQLLEQDHNVDVIIMDINMPVMNGIEATTLISQRWPQIKIVMSSVFDDEQNLFDAMMAGACGYLLKDEVPQKIHRSIFEALEGGMPMSAMIAKKALQLIRRSAPIEQEKSSIDYHLTERETEVLEQLSKGLTYDQIAENLFISYGTVRKHVENIYRKLGVNNRTGAIDTAQKGGIL